MLCSDLQKPHHERVLLEEGGRGHFMTRRLDRTDDGGKPHMQSLGALAHFDYNQAGGCGYDQALLVMRQLGLPMAQLEQQVCRMLNVVAHNQDEHVKNITFLIDKQGTWSLAPAFDVNCILSPLCHWHVRADSICSSTHASEPPLGSRQT